MNIMFLNAWFGHERQPLADFIREQAPTTDVFCFEEAGEALLEICREILGDEYAVFAAHKFVTEQDDFWQATYVRKTISVAAHGTVLADVPDTGLGLYVELTRDGRSLFVCNTHGRSRPPDKRDNPDRLRQAQGLIDFFAGKAAPVIIGGDFNMFPDTESIGKFSAQGYRDLIAEFGVKTTRNELAWRYPIKQLFADYIFLKGDIALKKFEVIDNLVSDHLPLVIEIS